MLIGFIVGILSAVISMLIGYSLGRTPGPRGFEGQAGAVGPPGEKGEPGCAHVANPQRTVVTSGGTTVQP